MGDVFVGGWRLWFFVFEQFLVYIFDVFFISFGLIFIFLVLFLDIYLDEVIFWQLAFVEPIFIVFLARRIVLDVSDQNGERRVEEGLEEIWVEVDDGEYPVEGVYYGSYYFKDLVQFLSVFADNNATLFGEDVVN